MIRRIAIMCLAAIPAIIMAVSAGMLILALGLFSAMATGLVVIAAATGTG